MFKKLWEKWKLIAEKIGNFQMKIVFSILYFILIFPIGYFTNFLNDFMNLKKFPEWTDMEDNSTSLKKLKEQY